MCRGIAPGGSGSIGEGTEAGRGVWAGDDNFEHAHAAARARLDLADGLHVKVAHGVDGGEVVRLGAGFVGPDPHAVAQVGCPYPSPCIRNWYSGRYVSTSGSPVAGESAIVADWM